MKSVARFIFFIFTIFYIFTKFYSTNYRYVLFVIRYHVANMNRQQETVARNHGNSDGGANKSFTPVYIRALSTTIVVVTVFIVRLVIFILQLVDFKTFQSKSLGTRRHPRSPTQIPGIPAKLTVEFHRNM